MSFTYGFYNSLNGDRKYNATHISRLFEGIINDGVFASIGDALQVTPNSGMTVNVGIGRAWFNNTWSDNDAIMPLTLDASEVVLNRIDAIVLEVRNSSDIRQNSIKILKGTPASSPANPTLIKTTGQYQYPLAYIYIGAGVTSITSGNITSKINTTECPTVKVVGVDGLIPLWEDEFNTWFAALQAQMSGDVATNLQNQINTNKNTEIANKTKYGTCSTASATVAKVATQANFSLVAGQITAIKFDNANTAAAMTLNINGTGAKAVYCCGAAVGADKIIANQLALLQYDGTYYQLLNPSDFASNTKLSSVAQTLLGTTEVDTALQRSIMAMNTINITSSQDWTVPKTGVYSVFIVGGGGAGGNGGLLTYGCGGSGGGGGQCLFLPAVALTKNQVVSCIIGAGGAKAATQATIGGAGGTTSFGTFASAVGGAGGGKGGTGGAGVGNGGVGTAGGGGGGYEGTTYAAAGFSGGDGSTGASGLGTGQAAGGGVGAATLYTTYANKPTFGLCPINGVIYGSGGGGGAGGGPSSTMARTGGAGGPGAGTGGNFNSYSSVTAGTDGVANRGGGGGGGGGSAYNSGTFQPGGNGGSGVIVISYLSNF